MQISMSDQWEWHTILESFGEYFVKLDMQKPMTQPPCSLGLYPGKFSHSPRDISARLLTCFMLQVIGRVAK